MIVKDVKFRNGILRMVETETSHQVSIYLEQDQIGGRKEEYILLNLEQVKIVKDFLESVIERSENENTN